MEELVRIKPLNPSIVTESLQLLKVAWSFQGCNSLTEYWLDLAIMLGRVGNSFVRSYFPDKYHLKKKKFLRKLTVELPYNSTIPLLGTYTEKNLARKYTCTPISIAAWYTIARSRKQPNCPSTDELVKKMWYIYIQWNTT